MMSVAFLIIDGYNLMHAAGLVKATYGPGDLARLRHQLLVRLTKRLTIDERKRCTVVFDAIDAPPDLPNRFKHEEMSVQFAPRGHEADELIESLILQHSAPRQLTVISSDHRLQMAIVRRRGSALDSDQFLKWLGSHSRNLDFIQRTSSSPDEPRKELDFWLDQFQDVEPDQLAADDLAQDGETKSDWERRIENLQQRLQDLDHLDEWLDEPGKP